MVAEHVEHRFSGPLAPVVERAVGYHLSGFPAGTHVGMPSTSLTLVIPLDEGLRLSQPGAGQVRRFDAVLAGLATRHTLIHHDGRQRGIQLALRPGAARRLLGAPAGELAGRSVELEAVLGPRVGLLRERLHEIPSWSGQFELVEDVLARLLGDEARVPAEVGEAWRVLERSGGAVRIRDVARHVGWSMRRLQEQFGREYGVAPKGAARLHRFTRSRRLVAGGRLGLGDIAQRCGFADQAHLNREWQALAGVAPTRWPQADALAEVASRIRPRQGRGRLEKVGP